MIASDLRFARNPFVAVPAVIFAFILVSLVYNHMDRYDAPLHVPQHPASTDVPYNPHLSVPKLKPGSKVELMDFYFKHLFPPSVSPTAANYTPSDAFTWVQNNNTLWPESLGQDLCIIDLDNRPLNESGQVFGPDPMSWQTGAEVHGLSAGIMNHWIYSKIHGYKYYFIQIEEPEDRRTSWKKATVIPEILSKHKTCIFLDSDAIFEQLDLPFEWLMNYWQLDPLTSSLALAYDPDEDKNRDKQGTLYLNTGFIVAQNNPRVYEIMKAWDMCPLDGEPYPGCTEFRYNEPGRPTDQGGFGNYIRYDYANDIVPLPCNEANGFPLSETECHGWFIRHLWTGKKDHIKIEVEKQTPGPYLELLHRQFLAERKQFFMTEAELFSRQH